MFEGAKLGLTEGQTAVRRLVTLGRAIMALVVIGVAVLLAAGSQALDDLQARQDRELAEQLLDQARQRLVSDVTTATVWDQAYRELRPGGNPDWADHEIGSYFANKLGHSWLVAIGADGAPFYARVGPRRADPRLQALRVADAAPLIRKVRAIERARGGRAPKAGPSDPAQAETASGVVLSGGTYYLVAASTVTPERPETIREPGPATVVISAQRLDGGVLDRLRAMEFKGPRVAAGLAQTPTSIPLRDVDGRPLGALSWTAEHPGVEALKAAAPALGLGLLIMAGAMGALGWQIRRVALGLHLHERAHDETLRALQEARDRAEAANIAKSQFLANMSHEIRTP